MCIGGFMKKIAFLLFFVGFAFVSNAKEGRFFSYPDVYKDKIVFSFEGDIWTVSTKGGTAVRLTSFPGTEVFPKFSPDGKLIAFTGSYEGNAGYVIPANGGVPKRITYNPKGANILGFTPDGKKVCFSSFLENFIYRDPNLFSVNVNGGEFEKFPTDRGVSVSFNNDGTKLLYVRKGRQEYQWKRYKGGQHTEIWLYDYKTNKFGKVTSYVGKNAYPMWIKDKMVFVSDRDNGVANLYLMDLSTKKTEKLTDFSDYDVMFAETDGEQIVFVQDGYIKLYNTKTKQTQTVHIDIPSDRWRVRNRVINPKKYIHTFDVGNEGETVVVEARGDIFTINKKTKETKNITNTPGIRERYPVLSPNGGKIAFFSDKSGEYQLYTINTDGTELKQLTNDLNRTVYHVKWSPDGKKLLFGNKDFSIFYFDMEQNKLIKVDSWNQLKNDEFFWEISDYDWSPDSNWIAYSTVAYNKNSVVKLYSLKTGKITDITGDFYDNLNPRFDKNGKYLYYMSSRNFDIQMDFYEDNHIVKAPYTLMAVCLKSDVKSPFEENEEGKDDNGEEKENNFRIDLKGIELRTYPFPIKSGNYFYLKAGKNCVMWGSKPEFTESSYDVLLKPNDYTYTTLHIYNMKEKKEVFLKNKVNKYYVSNNGDYVVVRNSQGIFVDAINKLFKSKRLKDKISTEKMVYKVDTLKEFNQIFSDCYRWYRDFFYDKNMHGHNWKETANRYRAFIPYLTSRNQLNWLMSQMVGELSVGHAYIWGGDNNYLQKNEDNALVFTGLLGADLVLDKKANRYKFAKIYKPTKYDLDLNAPLFKPDINVKEGDYLLAINGNNITGKDDYFRYLQVVKGQKVEITVSKDKNGKNKKTYTVEPLMSDTDLRYANWLAHNIEYVLKKTNGQVGYMHINDMSDRGIAEFDKFFRAFRYKKGLIIDVRRNSGGWTEYFLIDKLERKQVAYNVLQGMEPHRYPGATTTAKLVAISNEYNGSDGEAFIEDFKARKLGKVVGVPSWGGLVGIINGQQTIDNGMVHQPNNSFYGKEGKWWVENHGAIPDIIVDNDPASVVNGIDKQLDKAIEVVLEEIKQDTKRLLPPVPDYPVK
jgi:tricorn protease